MAGSRHCHFAKLVLDLMKVSGNTIAGQLGFSVPCFVGKYLFKDMPLSYCVLTSF